MITGIQVADNGDRDLVAGRASAAHRLEAIHEKQQGSLLKRNEPVRTRSTRRTQDQDRSSRD